MYFTYPYAPDAGIYVIKRPKREGPGYHFGLVLPDFSVVDFGRDTGIRRVDLNTFSEGSDVVTERAIPEAEHFAVYNRLRLAQLNPAQYDFWNWNCETFVNFLAGEEPRSDQVRWLGVAAAIFAVASIVTQAK